MSGRISDGQHGPNYSDQCQVAKKTANMARVLPVGPVSGRSKKTANMARVVGPVSGRILDGQHGPTTRTSVRSQKRRPVHVSPNMTRTRTSVWSHFRRPTRSDYSDQCQVAKKTASTWPEHSRTSVWSHFRRPTRSDYSDQCQVAKKTANMARVLGPVSGRILDGQHGPTTRTSVRSQKRRPTWPEYSDQCLVAF